MRFYCYSCFLVFLITDNTSINFGTKAWLQQNDFIFYGYFILNQHCFSYYSDFFVVTLNLFFFYHNWWTDVYVGNS